MALEARLELFEKIDRGEPEAGPGMPLPCRVVSANLQPWRACSFCACACACVCVYARARACVCACVRVRVCVSVCACTRARVCACVCASVCACVCVCVKHFHPTTPIAGAAFPSPTTITEPTRVAKLVQKRHHETLNRGADTRVGVGSMRGTDNQVLTELRL